MGGPLRGNTGCGLVDSVYGMSQCHERPALAIFSGGKTYHKNFPDPTNCIGTEIEKMNAFRKTRDLISEYLNEIFY